MIKLNSGLKGGSNNNIYVDSISVNGLRLDFSKILPAFPTHNTFSVQFSPETNRVKAIITQRQTIMVNLNVFLWESYVEMCVLEKHISFITSCIVKWKCDIRQDTYPIL